VEDNNTAYVPYAEDLAAGLEAAWCAGQFDQYKLEVGNGRYVILKADGSTRQYRHTNARNNAGRAVLRGYNNQVQQTYQQPTTIQQTVYQQPAVQATVIQQQPAYAATTVVQQQQPMYSQTVVQQQQPMYSQSVVQQQQPYVQQQQSFPTVQQQGLPGQVMYAQQVGDQGGQVYAQQTPVQGVFTGVTGYEQQVGVPGGQVFSGAGGYGQPTVSGQVQPQGQYAVQPQYTTQPQAYAAQQPVAYQGTPYDSLGTNPYQINAGNQQPQQQRFI